MRSNLLVAGLAALSFAVMPLAAAYADPVEVVDAAGAKGDVTDIKIKDMAFGTPKATVKKGTIVRWKNEDDGMSHNVHLRSGPAKGWAKAQGPMLAKDQSYALKFNEPGEYKYICTPHSAVMKGEITVE